MPRGSVGEDLAGLSSGLNVAQTPVRVGCLLDAVRGPGGGPRDNHPVIGRIPAMAYRLCGDPPAVDSEDRAAAWPDSLLVNSNVSLYEGPDLSVAPIAVLDPGNHGLLVTCVHTDALFHQLGIFRHSLAVPLRWPSRSCPLVSLPDSGPHVLAIHTSLGRSPPELRSPVSSSSSFQSSQTLAQPLIPTWPALGRLSRGPAMSRGGVGDDHAGWSFGLTAAEFPDHAGCLSDTARGPCSGPRDIRSLID